MTVRCNKVRCPLLFSLFAFTCLAATSEPVFQIPAGFTLRRVAGPPEINFPMFATSDDQGRIYVTESSGNDLYAELQQQVRKCRVSLLQDLDHDGVYESSNVFADQLTPSMGLVWREGKLYLADPPDLVALEDTQGKGHATKRTVILTGFGHTDNGSLHGLTFGPDGWLYFTTGNPDGYDLRGPDGSHARGGVGALLRCLPDGSRVETVARGFENLVEVVFLPDWSIIGTVTWYQLPERGIRDALVQLLEEGQFPIHPIDRTVPHLQFNAVLPAIALFPAVAHSGLELYHGNALPQEMSGNLFSAQHNSRKIVRHQLRPKGSSYACETFDFVTTEDPDVHFSDVLQDRDGSLLLIDTGSWYVQHCPTGRIRQAPARGGIYRIAYQSPSGSALPPAPLPTPSTNWLTDLKSTNVTLLAATARKLARLADTNAAPALANLLHSNEPQVRLAVAEAMTHCGSTADVPLLLEALSGETDAFLEHALTLALHRLASARTLIGALDHPSPKVQAAALLLLDQPPFQAATAAAVIARLNSSHPTLRDNARWVLLRHPEWGEAGAAFLRQLLQSSASSEADTQALARFLPVFAANPQVLEAVADSLTATASKVNDGQRAHLLEALTLLPLPAPPPAFTSAILQSLESPAQAVVLAAIRAVTTLRIPNAEEPLNLLTRDPARDLALRLEAMRELVRRRSAVDFFQMDFLLGHLSETNSPTTCLAAAEIIASAKLDSAQMKAFLRLIRGNSVISPAFVLGSLERNSLDVDVAEAVLQYLAASIDAGWTLSTEQMTKLQAKLPEKQRADADNLFARISSTTAWQRAQLTEFAPLLNGGDVVRGEKLFFEKAQCITCHRIWENGGRVGPDLSRIAAIRSGRDILESLLIPSATIAQGYDAINITTEDEETYTGIRIGTGDNPLRLRLASGSELVLHQNQIKSIDRSRVSLMPEGLLNNMQPEEIRDLLAFLQHLK